MRSVCREWIQEDHCVRGHPKMFLCTNSMMSGATEFVFLANKRQNDATLETIRCARAGEGLNCWPLQREMRYFLDGSDRYFQLDGVAFSKAKELLGMYAAGHITSLPGEMRHKPTNISLIKAKPDGEYEMVFGDYLCAGCVTKVVVKPETVGGEMQLVVIGKPDTTCF